MKSDASNEEKAQAPDYSIEKQRLECEKLRAEVEALSSAAKPSRLDCAEKWSKTVSIALIPVLLGLGAWFIQFRLAANAVSQEYVKLAVSILAAKPDAEHEQLRAWASQVLNEYSKIKMNPAVREDLNKGKIQLPSGHFLTDEQGNFITDEQGHRLMTE